VCRPNCITDQSDNYAFLPHCVCDYRRWVAHIQPACSSVGHRFADLLVRARFYVDSLLVLRRKLYLVVGRSFGFPTHPPEPARLSPLISFSLDRLPTRSFLIPFCGCVLRFDAPPPRCSICTWLALLPSSLFFCFPLCLPPYTDTFSILQVLRNARTMVWTPPQCLFASSFFPNFFGVGVSLYLVVNSIPRPIAPPAWAFFGGPPNPSRLYLPSCHTSHRPNMLEATVVALFPRDQNRMVIWFQGPNLPLFSFCGFEIKAYGQAFFRIF